MLEDSLVTQKLADQLPHRCHTLAGAQHDPMNLVLVGTKEQIVRAFDQAGWYPSDPPTPTNLWRALMCIIFNRPYPTGPITPMYIDKKVQSLSRQLPSPGSGFRRRHHVRIWETEHRLAGDLAVWTAHASFDNGVKLTWRPLFLTHSIAHDVDGERDFVAEELVGVGAKAKNEVYIIGPTDDVNAFGDRFETDGKAKVLYF